MKMPLKDYLNTTPAIGDCRQNAARQHCAPLCRAGASLFPRYACTTLETHTKERFSGEKPVFASAVFVWRQLDAYCGTIQKQMRKKEGLREHGHPGQGRGRVPVGCELSRSDDEADNGRVRESEANESPEGLAFYSICLL